MLCTGPRTVMRATVNPGFLLEFIFSRQSQMKGLSLVLAEEYELYVKGAFTNGLISSCLTLL